MAAICDKNVVNKAINEVSDRLIAEYNNYVSSGDTAARSPEKVNLLYENTALFNDFINRPEVKQKIVEEVYPNIIARTVQNVFVTPYEIDTMINQSLAIKPATIFEGVYTEDSYNEYKNIVRQPVVTDGNTSNNGGVGSGSGNTGSTGDSDGVDFSDILIIKPNDPKIDVILNEYEYYLGNNFKSRSSLSSFCDMAPSIFEKIQRVTDVFKGFKRLAGKISSTFSKISSGIASTTFSQLKNIVTDHVKIVFERELNRLKNFSFKLVTNSKSMSKRVATKTSKLLEDARAFFTEENMNEIQDSIKAQVEYVLDFFKEPSIEEIQYIVYRFCTLLTTLDHVFKAKISPLKQVIQSHDETRLALEATSGMATSRAIRAGAFRLPPQQYDATRSSYSSRLKSVSDQVGSNYNPNTITITPEDLDGVTPWNNGNGDSRIGFNGQWVTKLGAIGWTGVKPEIRIMIMQVQAEFGKRLIINSGLRPEWYNRTIPNAAKRSLHISGVALDVTWAGFSGSNSTEGRRFISICRKYGFTGFGLGYSSFIHVDTGNRNFGGRS